MQPAFFLLSKIVLLWYYYMPTCREAGRNIQYSYVPCQWVLTAVQRGQDGKEMCK